MANSLYTNPVKIDDLSGAADITVRSTACRIVAAKLISGTADEYAVFIDKNGTEVLHLTSRTNDDVDWFTPCIPFPVDGLYLDFSATVSGSQTMYVWLK